MEFALFVTPHSNALRQKQVDQGRFDECRFPRCVWSGDDNVLVQGDVVFDRLFRGVRNVVHLFHFGRVI